MISNRSALAPRLLACVVAMWCAHGLSWAHRQPEVFGTLVHDVEEGQLVSKVTWRLHGHDAFEALEKVASIGAPDLDSEETLIEIAGYVASWVDYGEAEPVTLGAEIDGDFVFVYQLVAEHALVTKAGILSDVSSDWLNFINVEQDGQIISTKTFSDRYPGGVISTSDGMEPVVMPVLE